MKNKEVEKILQEDFEYEIEKIYKQNDKESLDNKIKMIDEKYRETFREICDLLEYKLGRNSEYALYNIEEIVNDNKRALINFIENADEDKFYDTGIKSIVYKTIENLCEELDVIQDDKELDETNSVLKSGLNRANDTLDESREYASKDMIKKVQYKVEDSILTELKYNIKNILNRRELNDDEIEYEIGRILDRKLYQPIIEEFNLLEKINKRNIRADKRSFLGEISTKCMDEFKKELEEEKETEEEDKESEFIDELKDNVKPEEDIVKEESMLEDDEERRMKEIDKMIENLRF